MVLVGAAVLGIAAFAVYRLHGSFGAHDNTSTANDNSSEIVPFNPKKVVLEVFGTPGAVATINYLDVNAQPQRVDNATLPWSYTITSTDPAVVGNVVAQGNGNSIGCRITVNGVVRDQESEDSYHAQTSCLVKSA